MTAPTPEQAEAGRALDERCGALAKQARVHAQPVLDVLRARAEQNPLIGSALRRNRVYPLAGVLPALSELARTDPEEARQLRAALDPAIALWWEIAMTAERAARQQARRWYRQREIEAADWRAIAVMGAFDAAQRFDARRGPWIPFATNWIRARLHRAWTRQTDIVRYPVEAFTAAARLAQAEDDTAPSAQMLGVRQGALDCAALILARVAPTSLDQIQIADGAPDAESRTDAARAADILYRLAATPIEKDIVESGMIDGVTDRDMAQKWRVTVNTIRALRARLLSAARKEMSEAR